MNQLILRVVVNNSKFNVQSTSSIYRNINNNKNYVPTTSTNNNQTITAMKSNWISENKINNSNSKLYLFNNSTNSYFNNSSNNNRYYSTAKENYQKFIDSGVKEVLKEAKNMKRLPGELGCDPESLTLKQVRDLESTNPEQYKLVLRYREILGVENPKSAAVEEDISELETVDDFEYKTQDDIDLQEEDQVEDVFTMNRNNKNEYELNEQLSLENLSKEEIEYLQTEHPLDYEFLKELEQKKAETIKTKSKKVEVNDKQLPYFHAAKQAEKSMRAHLNRFFVKVHPDLFFNNVDQRTQNQQSLTKLNNLLRSLDEYIKRSEDITDQTKLEKIPLQFSLSFYAQAEEDGAVRFITQDFTFTEPSKEILTSRTEFVTYTTELRFAVYRQVYDLFQKSGITIPKSDSETVNTPESSTSEVYDDPWEEYFVQDKNNLSIQKQFDAFLAKYPITGDRLRSEFTQEHQALLDSFSDQRVFFYFSESIKGDIDYMRQLGHRDLAEEQLIHLKNNLMSIEYKDWINLPIVITTPENLEKLRSALTPNGFVVLPKDFKPTETFEYIKNKVLPETQKNFQELIDMATNNRTILEEATINLELALGSSSVVVENLFSLNQRSMDKVKEIFNTSMGEYGDLKIPLLQFLDQVKADLWREVPKTKFNKNEFGEWKMNNISTSNEEKLQLLSEREQSYEESGRVIPVVSDIQQRTSETLKKLSQLTNLKPDQREVPLELVDKNKFNEIQSSPFLNSTMDCVVRLSNLINNKSVKVPFYNTRSNSTTSKKSNVNQQEQQSSKKQQKESQEEEESNDIFYKANKVPITIDLQSNVVPSFVSTFDLPNNNSNNSNTTSPTEQIDIMGFKSIEDILTEKKSTKNIHNNNIKNNIIEKALNQEKNIEKVQDQQIEYVEQKLSDFEWTNINLIISDRYQFITTEDNQHGFCFIPNNFREEELFLFLNSIQDSFEKIHGTHLINLEKAEFIHTSLSLKDVVNELKDQYKFRTIKIDNESLPDSASQLSFLTHLRNSLVNESKLLPALPFVNLIVGTKQDIQVSEDGTIATVTLNHQEKNTLILFSIISDSLISKSQHFKSILAPNTILDDSDFDFLQESIKN